VCYKISETNSRDVQVCNCDSKIERLETRIENIVKLNNELHERILDLEAQVIKANNNLHQVLDGMENYINKNMLPIIKIPMIDTMRYVKGLIDWELTINESRYEEEKSFRL